MARLLVTRPSKNQLAQRKREKQDANRLKNLDAFWHKLEQVCVHGAEDEFLVRCEDCGQEQLSGNDVCVVCKGDIAVFSAVIESLRDDFPLSHEPGALRAIAS